MINTNLKEARFCLSEKEGGSEQLTENVAFVWHSDFRLWEVEKVSYDSFILWRWPPKAQKEFLIKSLQHFSGIPCSQQLSMEDETVQPMWHDLASAQVKYFHRSENRTERQIFVGSWQAGEIYELFILDKGDQETFHRRSRFTTWNQAELSTMLLIWRAGWNWVVRHALLACMRSWVQFIAL